MGWRGLRGRPGDFQGMIAPLPFSEDFQVQRDDTGTRVVRVPGLLAALGPLSGEMWVGVPDRLYFFWSLLAGGPGLGSGPVRFGIGHQGEHFSARAAWVGLIAPGPVLEVELPVHGELRLGGAVRAFVPQGFRKSGLGAYLFLAAHLR